MDLEAEKVKNAVLIDENSTAPIYLPEDSYYKTCCGKVHVETVAKYIAIVSLVLQLLSMLFGAYLVFAIISGPGFGSRHWTIILSFIWNAVKISCYVCILVAIKKRTPRLYWPFLIMNGLVFVTVCLTVIAVIVIPFARGYLNTHLVFGITIASNNRVTVALALIACGQLLLIGWMEMVVYKAYKYMTYHHNGSHNRMMMQCNNQISSNDPIKV